jgi:3-deoxy-manno-octulosonate cytidylyltransferase (CMP-KDO synthetase)
MASTRLPGKMLADINGKPMIEHVYQRAQLSAASRILIATDHRDIFDAAKGFGAEVVMTSPDHPSGTDRLQEVCQQCGLGEDEIVVNIQGDEPLIPAAVINQVAQLLANDQKASVATLCEAIDTVSTFTDPNVVKVVVDNNKRALYFSRAPIPWPRDEFAKGPKEIAFVNTPLRHLGIYAYRVALLNRFVTWPMASLESIEKLEQLRVLANGEIIAVAKACEFVPAGVDTVEDLQRVCDLFKNTEA